MESALHKYGNLRLEIQPLWSDILRLVALLSMLVDHADKAIHPGDQAEWTFLVGRIAFPLFLLVFSIQAVKARTSHRRRCAELGIYALITEPIFDFALNAHFVAEGFSGGVNILFVFLILSIIFWVIDSRNWRSLDERLYGGLAIAVFIWIIGFPLLSGGYGWFGLLSGLGFYLSARYSLLWLPLALMPILGFSNGVWSVAISLIAAIGGIVLCLPRIYSGHYVSIRFLPPKVFIVSYLGHLAILGFVGRWIRNAVL